MSGVSVTRGVTCSLPARQMRSAGSPFVSSSRVRPLSEGRPYSTATFLPETLAVAVSRGAAACADAMAPSARAAAIRPIRTCMHFLLSRTSTPKSLFQERVHEPRVRLAAHPPDHLADQPAER